MEQNTTDNNPIRILHFSDFHLNGNKINEAQHVLNNMINSLKKINEEKQIDLVIFLRDAMAPKPHEPNVNDVVRLCDAHNIPMATNLATAELIILAIDRGDLDWREMYK